MKKIIKCTFFILIALRIQAQNMNGSIGVITHSEEYSGEYFQFLNTDQSVWYQFTFHYDDSDGKWDFPNESFNVLDFHPDYFLLRISCVSETDSTYVVIVDERVKLKKELKKKPFIKFISWQEYVLSAVSIGLNKHIVLENPRGKILIPQPKNGLFIKPLEIDGDWLKISLDSKENPKGKNYSRVGWVKWRKDGIITVMLNFLC